MSTNPYASQWRQFRDATTDHELQVFHDDGLYRHLRMSKPGTGIWHWDIITWPGSLAIRGDIGQELIFTRLQDMFDFFAPARSRYDDESLHINPGYWAEKTRRRDLNHHSGDVFLRRVGEELAEDLSYYDGEEPEEVIAAACAYIAMFTELTDEIVYDDEHTARQWAEAHAETLGQDFHWDVDFTDWNHHYILSLYAIVTTVQAYRNRNAGSAA